MLFKFLLPALVLGAVYLIGRTGSRRAREQAVARPAPPPPDPAARRRQKLAVILPLIGITLLAGWMLFDDWRDEQTVVEIEVVNTMTHQTERFQALKHLVHLRTFTTLDGRRITLADGERMVVIEPQ